MNASKLKPGVFTVKNPGHDPFMLSVVESSGVIGVAAFNVGDRRPRKGKHILLTFHAREWINKLRIVK